MLVFAWTGLCAIHVLTASTATTQDDFVTVEKDAASGIWWFAHGGERFFSTGVSNLNNGGNDDGVGGVLSEPCQQQENSTLCGDTNNWDMNLHYAPYYNVTQALFNGSEQAWADNAVSRLASWKFNTLGGYSSSVAEAAAGRQKVYYNKLLMFATRFAMPSGTPLQQTTAGGCFAYDVFSTTFEKAADSYARANVLPRAKDPWLLGWHFEKEVSWKKMDMVSRLQVQQLSYTITDCLLSHAFCTWILTTSAGGSAQYLLLS
jgi:hypothetical protein